MCNTNNRKEKEKNIRDTAETLFRRRYEGVVDDHDLLYPNFIKDDAHYENECQKEFWKFSSNFIGAGVPRERKIIFTQELLNELEELSEENNVELSTLINCYLLQMLERNKRTTEHTKARKVYVKNSLYSASEYIQKCEKFEVFEKNIFDKDFIKYGEISYKNINFDEEIYIKNFLLNKGYTLQQIQQLEEEEKEVFGTFKTEEGEVMNPIHINFDLTFETESKKPVFDFDYHGYVFIPTRLGFHYICMNKSKKYNNYQDIESSLNSKLKGEEKIWDLYKRFLKRHPMMYAEPLPKLQK